MIYKSSFWREPPPEPAFVLLVEAALLALLALQLLTLPEGHFSGLFGRLVELGVGVVELRGGRFIEPGHAQGGPTGGRARSRRLLIRPGRGGGGTITVSSPGGVNGGKKSREGGA